MLHRTVTSVVLVFAAILMCARPAHAQQTVNFTLGHFAPLDPRSRVSGRCAQRSIERSSCSTSTTSAAHRSAESGSWRSADFVEAGAGVSYTATDGAERCIADFVDPDGTEIDQDLDLRTRPDRLHGPRTAVRTIDHRFSRTFGGGLGVINWRYRESGEFIDFNAGREIFEDTFRGNRQFDRCRSCWAAFDSPAGGSVRAARSDISTPRAICRATSPAAGSTSAAGPTTSRSARDSELCSGSGIRDRGSGIGNIGAIIRPGRGASGGS